MNEQLIETLALDLKPVRRRNVASEAAILGAVGLVELVLFLGMGQTRPDIGPAMAHSCFWWKLAGTGLLAVAGTWAALPSFCPTRSPRRGLRRVAILLALCFAAGWLIDAYNGGWPPLAERVQLGEGVTCVARIVALSMPPLLALVILMRRGAPIDSGGTGLAVGIAAAAWGAFVFVFSCPHDDPLWVTLWYGVACGAVTLAARLVLPSLIRW